MLIYGGSVYTGLFFIFLKKLLTSIYLYPILYMNLIKYTGGKGNDKRTIDELQGILRTHWFR